MKFAKFCIFSMVVLIAIGLSILSIPPASAQGDTWVTKASMPTGREGAAAAVIGNMIYVMRGYNESIGVSGINEAHDTLTDSWTTLTSAPEGFRGAEGSAAAAVGMEGLANVYTFGGRVIATVYAYNPNNDTWWQVANMPTARAGTAAVTVDNNIYVIGGRTGETPGSGIVLDTVEVYSPSDDKWWTATSMPTARSDLAAVALDGIIFSFGGWTDVPDGHSLNVVEAYDPAYDTWWSLPVMPTARNHALAGLCGADIHVVTGTNALGDPSDWESLTTHEVYTPSNNTWHLGGAAPIPHGRWEAVVGTANNSVYVLGGGGYGGNTESITGLNEQYICPSAIQELPEAEFTWSPTTPDEGEITQFIYSPTDPYGTIVSWDWDFGDGSPHSGQQNQAHVYGDNGVFTVTLTVTDNYGLFDSVQHDITVSNVAPRVDALPALTIDEGQTASFTGHATDPGSDDLTFEWSWEERSSCNRATTYLNSPPNPDLSPSPDINPRNVTDSATCTYGDNGLFIISLTVKDDDGGSTSVSPALTVNNLDPIARIDHVHMYVNLKLRVTGEKWHNVSVDVYENGSLIDSQGIERYPGNPNDQSISFIVAVDILRSHSLVVTYNANPDWNPVNGKINGANPVWLTIDNTKLKHTFVVTQGGPIQTWEIPNLDDHIVTVGKELTFMASASDPGSDDLTFGWDFDDGAAVAKTYCNDQGNNPPPNIGNPDPYPSPEGTFSFSAQDSTQHTYAAPGTYTVTLRVTDDDGGFAEVSVILRHNSGLLSPNQFLPTVSPPEVPSGLSATTRFSPQLQLVLPSFSSWPTVLVSVSRIWPLRILREPTRV